MPAHTRSSETTLHTTTSETDQETTPTHAEPLTIAVPPPEADAPVAEPERDLPSLRDAFFVLCQALEGALLEDIPACTHAQEIQAWMTNAGEDANGKAQAAQAWTHAVMLLEQVLGQSITHH